LRRQRSQLADRQHRSAVMRKRLRDWVARNTYCPVLTETRVPRTAAFHDLVGRGGVHNRLGREQVEMLVAFLAEHRPAWAPEHAVVLLSSHVQDGELIETSLSLDFARRIYTHSTRAICSPCPAAGSPKRPATADDSDERPRKGKK